MTQEQQYMMIFRYTPNSEYRPSPEEQAEMHQAWGRFIGNIAISEKLVSTHQLGFEGSRIHSDLSVEEGIYIAESKTLGGNMIVRAYSLEEATEMAKGCPILSMGGEVEVRSITPMKD